MCGISTTNVASIHIPPSDVSCVGDAGTSELVASGRSSAFDVVFSHVGMPDEDGLSMMRRLRARAPEHGGRVPAVALTAYSRSEHRADAIRAGFDVHLSKPVDPSELALVVAAVLRKRS